MNKVKKIWVIKDTEDGRFWMVDETGKVQWPPEKEQSRYKMSNFAFDRGADEVKHDYDLVKYDGSGGIGT